MSQSKAVSETKLQIRKTFSASREELFKAWTQPEVLKRWFGPGDNCRIPVAEVDLRVNGRYRIRIDSEGGSHQVTGVYREITSPEKLVFTWFWEEGGMDIGETLVTVEFRETGDSNTEVVLTHELLPNELARNNHREGWEGTLSRLARATQS